LSSKTEYIN